MSLIKIMRRYEAAWIAFLITLLVIVHVVLLRLMGRIALCDCGFGVWTSSAWGSETSQLVADPYSFSHVLHGIIFYWLLRYLPKVVSVGYRLVLAIVIEIGWELLENSPLIIERYRAATASVGYVGDSILNSVGDVACVLLGFWIAWKLPWKWTLVLLIAIELVLLAIYRDNLTLNIIMLIAPLDFIKEWQMAIQ